MGETSTKPYLIRALHEWCTDNGYTPYIVVQVDEHTMVPMGHVQDGQITLNVGTLATNSLLLGNEYIEFQARFGGVTENVAVHVGAVSAIYARETGAGMGFEVQPYEGGSPSYEAGSPVDAARETPAEGLPAESRPTLTVASDSEDDGQAASGAVEPAKSEGDAENKRPHLTIVK